MDTITDTNTNTFSIPILILEYWIMTAEMTLESYLILSKTCPEHKELIEHKDFVQPKKNND